MAGVLGTLVVILITAFYVASKPEPLVTGVLSLFPARRQAALHRVDEPASITHRSVTPRRGVVEVEQTLLPR